MSNFIMFILIIILFLISRFLFDNFVILKNKIINCEKQVDEYKEKIIKENTKNEENTKDDTVQETFTEENEIQKLETIEEETNNEMEKYDSFDF